MTGKGATTLSGQSPFAVKKAYKASPLSYLDPEYVREKAKDICRLFGSGSLQYEEFLNEINSDPLSQVTDLPRFTPGHIVNKKNKKSKKSKHLFKTKSHASKSVQSIETINEEKSEINNHIYGIHLNSNIIINYQNRQSRGNSNCI